MICAVVIVSSIVHITWCGLIAPLWHGSLCHHHYHYRHPERVQLLIRALVKSLHPLPATSSNTLSLLMFRARKSPRISLFQGPSSLSAVIICARSGSSFIVPSSEAAFSYPLLRMWTSSDTDHLRTAWMVLEWTWRASL